MKRRLWRLFHLISQPVGDENTGYAIYGYVLYQGAANSNQTSGSEVGKTNGFVHTDDTNKTKAADYYKTFNATIGKTTQGTGADKNHKFAFEVTFTNASVSSSLIDLIAATTTAGKATITDPAAGALASTTISPAIADSGSVTITGIPAGTTVSVKETNDTPDYYDVTATIDGTATTVAKINTAPSASNTVSKAGAAATENQATIAFAWTNEITLISPTGVVMRVAPYALMLIGGFVLLVISRRRKVEEA